MAMRRCLHDLYISLQVQVKVLLTQWSFWGLLSLPRYLQTVLAFSCSMLWMWPSSFWSSSWDRSASSSRNRLVTEPFGDTEESWRKREELTVKDVVQCHSITQLVLRECKGGETEKDSWAMPLKRVTVPNESPWHFWHYPPKTMPNEF